MTDLEGRFEQLERRVEQLETLLRQLLARTRGVPRVEFAPERPRVHAAPVVDHQSEAPEPAPPPRRAPSVPAQTAPPTPTPLFEQVKEEPALDLEEWIGKRGLLIVGIVALLATGVFFLEYAIQHQWIPPLVRSLASIAAGVGVVVWGHRLIAQGMRKYGGPVMGAGGGLIYLGIWAAAGPFDLVDRRVGIIALAVVATVFALLAQGYEIEGLAISALLGAFGAPLALRTPTPNPQLFLGYTEVVGIGGAIVAYAMEWRRTMFIAALGFMGLAALTLSLDDPTVLVGGVGLSFLIVGAVMGAEVSRRRQVWWEVRVITALGAWILITTGMPDPKDAADAVRWPALAAMTLICAVLFTSLRSTKAFKREGGQRLDEALLYLLTPVVLLGFALGFAPSPLAHLTAAVPVVIGVPYLVDGWAHRRAHALLVGLSLWAVANGIQFDPVGAAVGWAALAAVAAGAHALGRRPGLQTAAVGLYALGAAALFVYALPGRASPQDAFVDSWALGLWGVLAAGALVIWCWRSYEGEAMVPRRVTWWIGGATLFAGVSVNILMYFGGATGAASGSALLAVWWMVFAAGLAGAYARWKHVPVLPTALGVYVLGVGALFSYGLVERVAQGSAFFDSWALSSYAALVIGFLMVHWWGTDEEREIEARHVVWWLFGAALLAGGSLNIERFFRGHSGSTLAADLALSVWWLVFAAGAVAIGFRRDAKAVRSAGLVVALVGTAKVLFYDLSNLEALYRIGAFFVLAVIALGVAFAYHKQKNVEA